MPGGTDTTLPSAGATSEGSAAETTWARIAAAAERLGVESVTRATLRIQLGDSAEDTSVVLERIQAQTRQSVASFETLDTLGQGGMGIVFRARQAALEREVALKRLNTDEIDLHPVFLSEAQVMGRLEHANVPPVHSLTHDENGVPVLAMKLVRGAAWSALIGAGELLLADHVRLLLRVCDAVAFAHSRGIIHRDLKPDNVMVGDFGEVYVVDWGVAAAIDDDVSATSAILHVGQMPRSALKHASRSLLSAVNDRSSLDPRSARSVLDAHPLQLAVGDFDAALTARRWRR